MRCFRHFYTRCDRSCQLKSQILVQAKEKKIKKEKKIFHIPIRKTQNTHTHAHTIMSFDNTYIRVSVEIVKGR